MEKPIIKVDVTGPRESEKDFKNLIQLTDDIGNLQLSIDRHSEERPSLTTEDKGYMMFDEVLGKPIWWNGNDWVDAFGNPTNTEYQIVEDDNEQTE